MSNGLTIKQERYCQERLKGESQRQAYKIAFAPPRMTDKNIDEKASALERKDKVKARLNELKQELAKEAVWDRKKSLDALKGFYEIASKKSISNIGTVDSALVNAGIRAVAEINKMLGLNEPEKVELGRVKRVEVTFQDIKRNKNQDPKIVGEYTPSTEVMDN